MKTRLPLVISACIAITLTLIFLQQEYKNDPGVSPWHSDLPISFIVAAVFTSFFYGIFCLADRIVMRLMK
jgi:hypothetical protein